MLIIGCDFHPGFQQIAMVDAETGEHTEKRLTPEEAIQFYRQLQGPVRRREELLLLLDDLDPKIGELDVAVEQAAERDAVAQLLQTHPGVGPITALAFSLTLGQIERFAHSRKVVSYLGLNPSEHSSGGRQRLGSISKQGNTMLRSLLVEAGQSAARLVPELKRAYQRLKHRKHSAVAKVMVARKLAVRLYWMWKTQQPYSATRMQGSPTGPVARAIRPLV